MEKKYNLGDYVECPWFGSSENPYSIFGYITDIIQDEEGNYIYQIDNADYLYDFEIAGIAKETK